MHPKKVVTWEAVELVDKAKREVAREAAMMVDDGQILGLGTGSTAHYFIQNIGDRIKEEEIEIMGIPTSYQSFFLARDCGIPLTTLDEHLPDLAVDGADEVDPDLNLIKGGGAAHTLEKIVDSSAEKFLVIVDESKKVKKLGDFPVPLEVIPQSYSPVCKLVEKMGGVPSLRMAEMKDGPVITDNNNFVVDVQFNEILNPFELEKNLNTIPGVLENGIFPGMADEILIATSNGVESIRKP